MRNLRSRIQTVAIRISLFIIVAVLPISAFGYKLQYAKTGKTVRWYESCFKYSIHQDGAPDIDFEQIREAIRTSFDAWEEVDCSYFFIEETAPASCDKIGFFQDKGNTNLLVWRKNNWSVDKYHAPNAMALTTLSYDDATGQIYDADIEFNSEYFDFALEGARGLADIQNTATHEIGHMLGLDHSDIVGSTMYLAAQPGETEKRNLEDDDHQGLCTLYPLAKDPEVCKNPICGLDLGCTSTKCKGKGIGGSGDDDAAACSLTPILGAKSKPGLMAVLFSVLSEIF